MTSVPGPREPTGIVAEDPGAPAPQTALALRYVEEPRTLVGGHALRLLRDGREAFPTWLNAIDAARERVSMEMYIFSDDRIGRAFAEALGRAAERGVTVRLIYDFIGSRDTAPAFFAELRRRGVRVCVYHRHRFWRPRWWTLLRRNHRKTLVCDGRVAFTGGINIGDEWLPAHEGGSDWRDAAVEVRGPSVALIELAFAHVWNRRANRRFRLKSSEIVAPGPVGDVAIAVLANAELLERFTIRRAALHAIRESRSRVWVANPYFVPDRGVLRALCAAAARGVDVRVLLPAKSDVRIVDFASRAAFPRLLDGGVRIFEHKRMVHTKAMLVDDAFVSVGSYNLDHMSLTYNLELVVNSIDAAYAADVARMIEEEIAAAYPVDAEAFAQRSQLDRILERAAYALRFWL